MSAAPLELAWWGVRWGGVGDGQRQTEQGITLLELGEDAGRTSDRDEPLRPLLKLETLMLLSGTGLPRRHGRSSLRAPIRRSHARPTLRGRLGWNLFCPFESGTPEPANHVCFSR